MCCMFVLIISINSSFIVITIYTQSDNRLVLFAISFFFQHHDISEKINIVYISGNLTASLFIVKIKNKRIVSNIFESIRNRIENVGKKLIVIACRISQPFATHCLILQMLLYNLFLLKNYKLL